MSVMDVRRLVRAVALGGLVLLMAGGGIGFAVAAGGQADDAQTLTVPAPRPGDRAVYSVRQVILDEDVAKGDLSSITRAEYEWQPERWEVDADFRERLVHPLRSWFTVATGSSSERVLLRESTYDAATGEVVSETQLYETTSGGQVSLGLPGGVNTERSQAQRYDGYMGQMGPCGFRVPFQGSAYDGEDFWLQGNCDWPEGLDGFTYTDAGWGTTRQGRVRTFHGVEDSRFFLEYDEEAPFPARAAAVLSEIVMAEYTYGRYFVLDRVAFAKGSGGYTPVEETVVRAPADPVDLAPRTAWGLDDSDVTDHRFPLSQAYAAVLANEGSLTSDGGTDTSEWLARHPSAYLASATTWEGRDRFDQPLVWWYLVWTDGRDVLGKQVSYGPPGLETWLLPGAVGNEVQVFDWDPEGNWPWAQHGITQPEDVPAALPRPADLMGRYTALTGEQDPNRYSFSIECADPACSATRVYVIAGRLIESFRSRYTDPADQLVRPYSSVTDHLMADGDGRMEFRWSYVRSESAAVPLVPPTEAEATPDDDPTAALATTWAFPAAPAAATGVSLLALVVSALYYFWPTLKGLPIAGLFSRIENDRVLEHPARRTLHALVEANPGIHFQELARKAGFGRGQLEHHLRKLQAANLVSRVEGASYTCFFARGQHDRRVMAAAPLLRSDGGRAVLGVLQELPGATSRQIAARLGLSAGTVSYHVKRLREAGLLESSGGALHLTDTGRKAGVVAA